MVKIGIIGAGIGGCSLAYFLSKKMPQAEITVFEKNKQIGGRVSTVDIDGFKVEIGGVYFHSINQELKKLTEEVGIETELMDRQRFGLWDGKQFVFKLGKSNFLNNFRLLWRFGFNLTKIMKIVNSVKDRVDNFYSTRFEFSSIDEMLQAFNSYELAKNNIENELENWEIKPKLINELIIPTTRYVYLQEGKRSMNAFSGFVSLIAYDNAPVHYVRGGNIRLCERLLEKSGAVLKSSTKIIDIEKISGGYTIETEDGQQINTEILVIASPLEITELEVRGISTPPEQDRVFKSYCKNIIIGDLNPAYFNQGTIDDVPEMILTTEELDDLMFGIEKIGSTDAGEMIYEITASEKLNLELIEKMFTKIIRFDGYYLDYTFPDLSPTQTYEPIILDRNLFYLNAVDSISPTLESSVVMAKNITNLILRHLNV